MVYAKKGTKEVLFYMDGTDREVVTVLACGDASVDMLRPLILFDGKMHIGSRSGGTENECLLGVDKSVVMDADIFMKYVTIELLPKMTADKVTCFVGGGGKISLIYQINDI